MIVRLRRRLAGAATVLALAAISAPAYAAGSNMPWEAPLQSILDSIQGPVAKILSVIVIVVTGLNRRRFLALDRRPLAPNPAAAPTTTGEH